MRSILLPSSNPSLKIIKIVIPLLLGLSAAFIFIAPFVMPDTYSWIKNVISESAAQNVQGAWVARLGFICFGLAVLWLSVLLRSQWARGAYWCHVGFGIFMVSTAAFSHKPWIEILPFDAFEDFLHSITATGMGFAFSFGVLIRLFQRREHEKFQKGFDILAVVAATVLPMAGWFWPPVAGLVQRLMFLVAYLWYGYEAITACELRNEATQ